MNEGQGSGTALGVSVVRAIHQIVDTLPHILEDPISQLLLDEAVIDKIRNKPDHYRSNEARGLRSHVVLRSRYAEDTLQEAITQGNTQFVSLGAGYDTFPYRQPQWARNLRIVEMDYPATQREKRAHFRGKGLEDPDNLSFFPLDLETDNLSTSIAKTSLNPKLPIWISCLGVFAYLRKQTVYGVFKAVAELPKGSGIVFAFAPEKGTSDNGKEKDASVANRAAELGEPWLTRFTVEDLRIELKNMGFKKVSFLEPSEAEVRYFGNRTDIPAPKISRLCEAIA